MALNLLYVCFASQVLKEIVTKECVHQKKRDREDKSGVLVQVIACVVCVL